MDRRLLIGRGLGALGLLAFGCGREEGASNLTASTTSEILDIQCRAGGIPGGVLPKEFIRDMIPVRLAIYEGSHSHDFLVGQEHYTRLIAGEIVRLTSEVSSGHTHTVTIDPSLQPTFEVSDVHPYDFASGEGGLMGETLTRAQILAGEPVTLAVDEGGHVHDLLIETKDLCGLRAGVTLKIRTNTIFGHDHLMVLDPRYVPTV